MSSYLNVRLSKEEADAVYEVLAIVLNDPSWWLTASLPDPTRTRKAVDQAERKLGRATRAVTT